MTDLDLQKALVAEIKSMRREESLGIPRLNEEETFTAWDEYKVYAQDLPFKDEEIPEERSNYILVVIDDEDTDSEGNWIVTVHFVISICIHEMENQGNLIVATLMNQLERRFDSKGIIAGLYTKEKEAHKRFNQDAWPDFFEGDYITKWKIPGVDVEEVKKLI